MFTIVSHRVGLLLAALSVLGSLSADAQVLTVQVGTPPPAPTPIVDHSETWRWRRSTSEPQANWRTVSDAGLDASWTAGAGGFGYGDPTIVGEATTITGMEDVHRSIYIRRAFAITNAIDPAMELRLVIDYDDGFVAFLDGIELTRANVAGESNSPLSAADSRAIGNHEASCCGSSANPASTYNFGAVGNKLFLGTHVLSFMALNDTTGSSDLHIIPDLSVASVQGNSGIVDNGLYALSTSNTLVLTGTNTIAGSTRVTVNGDDASLNAGTGTWSKTYTLTPGMNRLFIAALDNAGNLLSSVTQEVVYQANSNSVSGTLAASTTWNDPGTVIYVTANTFIPAGGSLNIGPGVVVILPANASIIGTNNSVFSVQGTDASPAYFLPVVPNGFGSLTADGANASLTIRQAHVVGGQVRGQNGAGMLLEDMTVRDLPDLGREVVKASEGTSLTMRRVYMTRFSEMDSRDTPVLIEDSLMEGFLVDGADIKATNSPLVVRRTTLRNADPGNSNADGIDFGPGAGTVEDCLIYGFPDKGVSIGGAPGTSVRNSLIYNCGVGISCYASTNVVIENTTISLCLTGFFFRANPTPGVGVATNVIVWGNNFDTVITGGSVLNFAYSDVAGGVRPGPGNISADPLFVDAPARDFRLLAGSPASGSGLGGVDMGATLPVGGLPPAPFNLAAISIGTNLVTVQWEEDAANESAFLVERSTNATTWEQIGSVPANQTNFADATGVLGQKYYYRARATNDSGLSHVSNIASGTRQPPVLFVGGTIATSTLWPAGISVVVTSSITVAASATLTIEPCVRVLFNQGFSLNVNGVLIAEGTPDCRIVFTRNTGASTWSTIDLSGASSTHRLRYVDLEYSTGNIDASSTAVYLENVWWTNTTAQLVDCVSSSLTLLDSYIPGNVSGEPVHFSTMPANGYALIKGNVFAAPSGYNDNADLTGGNRPGPILQLIDNVFLGSPDDCLDLDATDAHIEGNIFMNVHQSGYRPSSANAIALGEGSGTSEAVVVRNIFYDCDHAMLLKDFGSAVFDNNTVVTIRTNQFSTNAAAYLNFGEPHRTRPGGRGILMNGNIMWDLHSTTPFLNFTNGVMFMVANQNIIQGTNFPTGSNSVSDPLFVNWQTGVTYQNIKSNLALLPGSPAIGTGPNGLDRGALVPAGPSISGEPAGSTTNSSATLKIGGPGVYAYRWKLNNGPWSAEVSLTNDFLITPTMFANAAPITLNNLTNGPYTVYVIGKNSAGYWQDTNSATVSKTWTVGTGDSDGDGIPDEWEIAFNFDQNDPDDAAEDADTDGMNNLQEFLAGTNPTNNLSRLAISIEWPIPAGVPFQFEAQSNKSYTVQYRTSLTTGEWLRLQDVAPVATNRNVALTNSTVDPTRFFRVVTPQQP